MLCPAACVMVMRRDYSYWGLDWLQLEPCCLLKFYPELQSCAATRDTEARERASQDQRRAAETRSGDTRLAILRCRLCHLFQSFTIKKTCFRSSLWDFLEKPWTSEPAKIFAFFSLSILFISTITFVVSTVDEFSVGGDNDINEDNDEFHLLTVCKYVDTFTFIFFTAEYCMRLACCPQKWAFCKEPMNLIDFLTLLPFYFALVLEELADYQLMGRAGKMLRLMKIMKIFRVYKLFRHFAGLRSLLYTLKQAYKELGLLFHVIGKFKLSRQPR